jgi:hypothetical protein
MLSRREPRWSRWQVRASALFTSGSSWAAMRSRVMRVSARAAALPPLAGAVADSPGMQLLAVPDEAAEIIRGRDL